MKITAPTQMAIPTAIFKVKGSPNRAVPIRIAVSGSKTPRIEVFVGPMYREEIANARSEIIVGTIANPTRFPQSAAVQIPSSMTYGDRVTPGQLSVRKGQAGRPSLLKRLQTGLAPQP